MTCPSEFEANCKNRDLKCEECSALDKSTTLWYDPYIKGKLHPATNLKRIKIGRNNNERGRSIEKQVVQKLNLVPTEASGAKFRDGDGKLVLADGTILTVSIKSRSDSLKLGLAAKEYDVTQLHIVNSKEYGNIVIMSEYVFRQLQEGFKL
jgi:hypothetical protein